MTRRLLVAAAVLWCVTAARPAAQRPTASEYDVKAAYLFSFGRFVQWPPGPQRTASTFDICVIGADPFGPALDHVVEDAQLGGRRVQARRITAPDAAGGCHVLFVADTDAARIDLVLKALAMADVLTVGDSPGFLDHGGMIRFVTQGSRVRFEVNLTATQASGLTLSSDLLRVASVVRRERQ